MKNHIIALFVGLIITMSLSTSADVLVSEGVITNFYFNFGTHADIVVGEYFNGASVVVDGGSLLFVAHNAPYSMTLGADRDASNVLTGQFQSDNSITVTGGGSELISEFIFVSGGPNNSLVVSDGGGVLGTNYQEESAGLCIELLGATNAVLLTGYGSYLSGASQKVNIAIGGNGNTFTMLDGAEVKNGTIDCAGTNCSVVIAGSSTTWDDVPGYGAIDFEGASNSLAITNGANVNLYSISDEDGAGSNKFLIDGVGTVVNTESVTLGPGDSITLSDRAQMTATGQFLVDGALNLTGSVGANAAVLSPDSSVRFDYGTFATGSMDDDAGEPFVIGDGTNCAVYEMEGGAHSFLNGLVISSNSVLSGCGEVVGSVTNYGLIILTNGCDMSFGGAVLNYGTILALNGIAHFQSTIVNDGTLFQNAAVVTGLSFSGSNVNVQFNTVSNYPLDVQASGNLASNAWVTLTNGLTGTGNPMTITDFGAATNAQRFYRVLQY